MPTLFVEEEPELTLAELCQACGVSPHFIQSLLEHGVIEIRDFSQIESATFSGIQLRRIRTVVRLQNDLEVNLPGAALALDLLDELEELRARVSWMEKQLR